MIQLMHLWNLGTVSIVLAAFLAFLVGWNLAQADDPDAPSFVSIVGFWEIAADDGIKVLMVDGSRWQEGKPSEGH